MTLFWSPAPTHLNIGEEEVHVWAASLDKSGLSLGVVYDHLSSDERARAGRFRFLKDQERFVAARGLLRTILGRYLDTKPNQLRFRYNPQGKPSLAEEFSATKLSFNVSHCQQVGVFAVTIGRELGVDIEQVKPEVPKGGVAERFFSPGEVEALRAIPPQMQVQAFFACWTRKEAYIKAKAGGLSIPLDQFEVSLAPGQPAVLKRVLWDPEEACRWGMRELSPAPGYTGALCVEGHGWKLECWRTPEGW